MPKPAIRKSKTANADFIPMRRTRAMMSDVWDHLRDMLGHTPDTARRVLNAAIKELHANEVAAVKKAKKKLGAKKKTARKAVAKIARVKKTVKRKIGK